MWLTISLSVILLMLIAFYIGLERAFKADSIKQQK